MCNHLVTVMFTMALSLSMIPSGYSATATMSWTTSNGDCYIRRGSPGTAGNAFGLQVGWSSTTSVAARRSLVQWDMTGAPPQSAVVNAANSVRVKLYCYTRSVNTAYNIDLAQISANWAEGTATWTSMAANTNSGAVWATTAVGAVGDYTWQWNGNTLGIPVASRGVMVLHQNETLNLAAKTFTDKELTGGANPTPRMEVDYTVPVNAPTATAPSAITASSITWNWTAGTPVDYGGHRVYDAASGGTVKATVGSGTVTWNETGLAPNTSYQRWVCGYTGNANGSTETARSASGAKYTLAAGPSAANVTPDNISPCPGSTVTWTAVGGFGAGTVQYYRYAWDQSPTHTWTDSETQWSSGTIQTTLSSPGAWYLHLKSFNAEDVGNNTTFDYAIPAVFSESMGTVAATTAISAHETASGFDNDAYTMSGTADVRATTPSSGYGGASGGANVFISNTAELSFQIADINTAGLASFQLSFGVYKSTTASSGSELAVEVSSDGTTYTPLSFPALPTGTGTAIWHYRTASGTIPATSNLRIRFRQTGTGPQFRIDDVSLTHVVPTTSAIAGNSAVAIGQAGQNYSVTLNSGSSYVWTVPTGASITAGASGPDNNQITVAFGSVSGNVTVTETTAGGCVGSPVSFGVTVGPNNAPTAQNFSLNAQSGLGVRAEIIGGKHSPSDPDSGDTLAVVAVSSPTANGATVTTDGIAVTYTALSTFTGTDSFTYTVSDGNGGTAVGTVSMTVSANSGASPNIVSPPTYADGKFSVTFAGIPNAQYTVEYAEGSPAPPWTKLKNVTAGANGLFVVEDTASESPSRYYRTVYPSY